MTLTYHFRSGRGIPDIAAQATFYSIIVGGQWGLIGGTSASAPAFAALVALLNDARLKKGLPSLGFLNPLIYNIGVNFPEGFNDIIAGNNPGCGTPGFNVSRNLDV